MVYPSDSGPVDGNVMRRRPPIDDSVHVNPDDGVIEVSLSGAHGDSDVVESHAVPPTEPSKAISAYHETIHAYPIFDRDGRVARMIGVDSPAHQPEADEPDGNCAVPPRAPREQSPIVFCDMVATSAQMRALFELVRRVSASNATILIYGESGTGKELVARAIHQCSDRRRGPFVPINCGALPDTLLESELFGHVRGAFTGAMYRKKGLFEEATGGTIFLDEIGDTSPAFQAKLLRALQEGEIRSVGGTRTIKVDVRVVAATNTSLKNAIAKKSFREDLYYRLAVVPIRVPSLRERPDDILPLTRYFIAKYARQSREGEMRLASDAADLLQRLSWKGNVRELENVVERAVLIAPRDLITPESIVIEEEESGLGPRAATGWSRSTPIDLSPGHSPVTLDEVRSRAERDRIVAAIQNNRGNRSLAARSLGISRSSLYNKLKRYDLGAHNLGDPRA
ncbi:MAG: sigma-54 interaction domain-containing protein [Nitrospirota bacterium]